MSRYLKVFMALFLLIILFSSCSFSKEQVSTDELSQNSSETENSLEDKESHSESSISEESSKSVGSEYNFKFWEKGNEQVEYRDTVIHDTNEAVTQTVFLNSLYFRDYDQLKEFCTLYDLPCFHLCSPFDGSEPEYSMLDKGLGLGSCFPIPGRDGEEFFIRWEYLYQGEMKKYDQEWFDWEYENWKEYEGEDSCYKVPGEVPLLRYYSAPNDYRLTPCYNLSWGYQGTYFYVADIAIEDSELLETLITSIQEKSYIINE